MSKPKTLPFKKDQISNTLGVITVLRDNGLITNEMMDEMVNRATTIKKSFDKVDKVFDNLIRNAMRQTSPLRASILGPVGGDLEDDDCWKEIQEAADIVQNYIKIEEVEFTKNLVQEKKDTLAEIRQGLQRQLEDFKKSGLDTNGSPEQLKKLIGLKVKDEKKKVFN